jgi:hypothetical protein
MEEVLQDPSENWYVLADNEVVSRRDKIVQPDRPVCNRILSKTVTVSLRPSCAHWNPWKLHSGTGPIRLLAGRRLDGPSEGRICQKDYSATGVEDGPDTNQLGHSLV